MRLFRAAKVHLWIVPAFIGVAALATVFLLAMTLRPGFTISFYVENAVYYTIRTNGNQNISFPKEPTKTGYVFEGWFFDNGTWNEPFEKDTFRETKLEENKNVYAKFTAKHLKDDRLAGLRLPEDERHARTGHRVDRTARCRDR